MEFQYKNQKEQLQKLLQQKENQLNLLNKEIEKIKNELLQKPTNNIIDPMIHQICG